MTQPAIEKGDPLTELSDKAIEVAAKAAWEPERIVSWDNATREAQEDAMKRIRLAASHIIAAYEEQLRERLLSDKAIDAAEATSSRRGWRSEDETARYKERIRAVIEAAFDAADLHSEGGEDG